MSPEVRRARAYVTRMLSVDNDQLAATSIDQQIEYFAGTLLAFVKPEHHAEMCGCIAKLALERAAAQHPNAVAWAGELLAVYREHDTGVVS